MEKYRDSIYLQTEVIIFTNVSVNIETPIIEIGVFCFIPGSHGPVEVMVTSVCLTLTVMGSIPVESINNPGSKNLRLDAGGFCFTQRLRVYVQILLTIFFEFERTLG